MESIKPKGPSRPKKANFRKGSTVIVKSGKKPAVIIEAVGLRKWSIRQVGTNGKLFGPAVEKTSQQLRHPTVEEEFSLEESAPEEAPPMEEAPLLPGSSSSSSSSSNGPSYRWETHLQIKSKAIETVLDDDDATASVASETDSVSDGIEDDPDDVQEEVPYFLHDVEYGEEIALEPNDLVVSRGIELDESKHKAKWDQYILDKEQLIADKWTVQRKPPHGHGLEIGSMVAERRKGGRKGLIVGDDREEDGKPAWTVMFEGEPEATSNIPSTKLKGVKDERIFTWETVRDSVPDDPVEDQPYSMSGVVGFDFSRIFGQETGKTSSGA
ncbi:hypothetical protein SEMRO_675_G185440.1 [Seminavis robusta]|uniref:Uncharacterized protein n=1 Tax=Seminavis robusta TaxID=568900 RepID=A0A9N8E6J7_9STRA|nr:hypothetical protein SEMRO_675_G185440.1 [Seminavis robusta]|eukprot:Sro675_g185440.1 n/a (326) ;mRNA; r:6566-7613